MGYLQQEQQVSSQALVLKSTNESWILLLKKPRGKSLFMLGRGQAVQKPPWN